MGSYAAYTEAMNIPPERFPTFNRYMEKILNYGGIIWRYNRKVMGHDITLICPVNFMNEESNGVQGVQTRLKRKDRFESK